MKAITLHQPYAQLAVIGAKRIETRGWSTTIRGRVAIHAGKKDAWNTLLTPPNPMIISEICEKIAVSRGESMHVSIPEELAYGAVVGRVEIIGCFPIEQLFGTEYDTPQERAFGDWSPGRFGWILRNPIQFTDSVPAKGKQGFWTWEDAR